MQFNMHDAKTNLSKLGKLAWEGEKIVIAKSGKPYLDLVPHKENNQERVPGRFKGQIEIKDDFDQCNDEIAALFTGESE